MSVNSNGNVFPVGAFAVAIIAAAIICGLTVGKLTMPATLRSGHYSSTGWNYYFKKWWVKHKISKQKRNRPMILTASDGFEANAPKASPEEHMFFGCDHLGNMLLINENNSVAHKEVYLYLRLRDGQTFTLPEYPMTTVISDRSHGGHATPGLSIECLLPYTKWRLTFSGLLKRPDATEANELQHVAFTFFWTAASDPLDLPYSLSTNILAASVATESGRTNDLLNMLTSKFQGHDQFGSLLGQITIADHDQSSDDKEVLEVNLPGVRQRRWVDIGKDSVHRVVTFIGVCENGSVFVLGAKSFKEQLTHVQFGFLRKSNGKFMAIDSTDFHLADFAENDFLLPKTGRLAFRADGENSLVTIHFHTKTPILCVLEGRPLLWKTNITTAAIGLDYSAGYGICISGYPLTKCEIQRISQVDSFTEPPRIHLPSDIEIDRSQLFVSFAEPECRDEKLSGGKGASLGILYSLAQLKTETHPKFHVPNGFVLTTNAHKLQMDRRRGLRDAVTTVADVAHCRVHGELTQSCKHTNQLFKDTVIEPEIMQAILAIFDVLQENYANQGNADGPFRVAVRSSAVGEDRAESSAAGQNDTFLGCRTAEDVAQAVKSCWASLYSYHSVTYRKQNMQPIATRMAVVIQTMVAADCAGVLFTRHPVDNDAHKMLVSANYGLGESVVSGAVDPDVFTIQRSYCRGQLRLTKKMLGQKSHEMHLHQEDGSVEKRKTQAYRQAAFCLSDEQIIELAEIGIFLEQFYGSARDIEWAIHKDAVHMLQSRPMTSLTAFTPWELLHEFDTAIMSPDDVSTFGNIGEVLPEVITPLTYTTFGRILDINMSRNVLRCDPSPFHPSICRLSHYRMAFEVCNMFLQAVEPNITPQNRMHGLIVFGHEFVDAEIHRIALERNGVATARKTLPLLWDVVKTLFTNRRRSDDLQKLTEGIIGMYDPPKLMKFRTALELFLDLKDNVQKMGVSATAHGHTSKTSTIYQMIALTILTENKKELTTEHTGDIALMLSSCNDIESAYIPRQLSAIANEIRSMNIAEAFGTVDPSQGVEWLETNCDSAHTLLLEFLTKHTHRAYKELELATETWGMRPELVITMLQASVRHAAPTAHKAQTHKTNEEIAAALTSPKKNFTRRCIKWILPSCQASVRIREQSKNNFIAYVHEIRKGYRHLARMMHNKGYLPSEETLFYLTEAEIGTVLLRMNVDIILRAGRRKRMFNEWRQLRFDEMQFGLITPMNDAPEKFLDNACVRVVGTPVCAGVISGRACVLRSFDDVALIQSGDILITHSTDIGWSPYFPMLGGVVTELGGLISHGAVVAREYGLPCIVGAIGATHKIHFGDKVRMDANTGVLVMIE